MPKSTCADRRLTIENLENRQLLAGDVMVDVSRGNLVIVGDEADNQLHISSGQSPGEYMIVGLPGPDGTETTINGQTEPLVVNDAFRSVRVATGDGNDVVDISHANFRHLDVHTGPGDDIVRLGLAPNGPGPEDPNTVETDLAGETDPTAPAIEPSVTVRGRLRIGTGEGNDTVVERHLRVGHSQAIHTGEGDDNVILDPPNDSPVPPDQGETAEATGQGDASPTTPPGGPQPSIQIGRGLKIGTGAGNDNVILHGVNAGSIHIRAQAGDDTVALNHVHSRRGLSIGTDGGDDTVVMNQVHSRWARVETGADSDRVELRDSAFAVLGSFLGDGDDALHLAGTTVGRVALLNGGPGTDELLQDADTHLAHARIAGFELPPSSDDEEVPV
jgi:hypothetical protein